MLGNVIMKLYNVLVEATYEASYEGEINRDYTRLVFAETEQEAIDYVNDGFKHLKEVYHIHEKAKTAYEVDSSKGQRKRKAQYYVA